MDTKRVISALTSAIDLAEKTGSVLVKTTPDVAKAAVEMLKVQPVRCRDCKRVEICCRRPTDDPDWFCADGVKKDG